MIPCINQQHRQQHSKLGLFDFSYFDKKKKQLLHDNFQIFHRLSANCNFQIFLSLHKIRGVQTSHITYG